MKHVLQYSTWTTMQFYILPLCGMKQHMVKQHSDKRNHQDNWVAIQTHDREIKRKDKTKQISLMWPKKMLQFPAKTNGNSFLIKSTATIAGKGSEYHVLMQPHNLKWNLSDHLLTDCHWLLIDRLSPKLNKNTYDLVQARQPFMS